MIETNIIEYKVKLTGNLEKEDLDIVKQLSCRINRILSFYKKDIFIFDEDFLRMVFISNYDKIKTTQETDPKTLDGKMQNV